MKDLSVESTYNNINIRNSVYNPENVFQPQVKISGISNLPVEDALKKKNIAELKEF